MYDPRYSPVYQIPYQPLYEVTRHQIQHGLLSLEQKLRRRRQIDRQLAFPIVSYPSTLQHLQRQNDNLRRLQQQNIGYRAYQQQNLYRLKVANQLDNAARIQKLRLQRDLLANEQNKNHYISPSRDSHRQSYEDDQLIKKYQNGSMARNYYEELQNQRNKRQSQYAANRLPQNTQKYHEQIYNNSKNNGEKNQQQIDSSPIQKQIKKNINHRSVSKFQSQRKDLPLDSNFKRSIYETPYDKIKQNYTNTKRSNVDDYNVNNQIKGSLEKKFNKIDKINQHQKNNQPTKKIDKHKVIQDNNNISQNQDNNPVNRLNRYQSLGKIHGNNRSKSNYSPFKRSFLQNDYLDYKSNVSNTQAPKKSIKQIQLDALKKIENRLKVSKVIYQDSKFRNIKYEGNHLYNTYEIEVKQRNELRQKINNNLLVLRKHSLVVE